MDFFYNGLCQINIGFVWLFIGIEQWILKKKKWAILYFAFTVVSILLAIETFHILELKQNKLEN